MATINTYGEGPKRRWRVRWTHPVTGKQLSQGFKSPAEAKAKLLEVEAAIASATAVPMSSRAAWRLGDVAADWYEHRFPRLAPASQEVYASMYDRHIAPALGGVKVQDMARDVRVLDTWLAALVAAGTGEQTIVKTITVLSSILTRAVDLGICAANPAHRLEAPCENGERHVRALDPLTIERLRWWCLTNKGRRYDIDRRRDALVLSLIGWMGMRPGEVRRLRWEHLMDQIAMVEGRTKNKWRRHTPMPAAVKEELLALQADTPGEFVLGREWSAADWRNFQRRVFTPAAEAVGKPEATPYWLRHSYVSARLRAGDTAIEIAGHTGHSPETMYGTYSHFIADAKHLTGKSIDEQIADAQAALAVSLRAVGSEGQAEAA